MEMIIDFPGGSRVDAHFGPFVVRTDELTSECFIPLTYGGGIHSVEQIRKVLLCGADKVAINSAAYENPKLLTEAADLFGSQCVVASIDVRKHEDGTYECFKSCGSLSTGKDPVVWAQEVEAHGAGEILLTRVELDGSMAGYDLELIRRVSEAVQIPVIASGGAGKYEDLYQALVTGKASAVAAAAIFHYTEQTPLEAKAYLKQRGIQVRNANVSHLPTWGQVPKEPGLSKPI